MYERTKVVLKIHEHGVARAVSIDHEPSTSRMVAELVGYNWLQLVVVHWSTGIRCGDN